MSDIHSGSGRVGESLAVNVGDVSNTLLLSPTGSAAKHEACVDMLRETRAGDASLLGVVPGETDQFLGHLRQQLGSVPSSTTVVAFGGDDADAAAGDALVGDGGSVAPTVEHVPAGSGRLSTRVREHVADAGESEGVHVCFDSISAAVESLGRQRTFNFVNTLTSACADADVGAHYHMDPERHDQQTMDALSTLFDAVATAPDGEEWEVVWTRSVSGEPRREPRG